MDGFGGEQRRVWLRRFVEQLEDALRLLAVQPNDRLALQDFLRLPMGCLHDEIIQRRAFEVGGGLDGFAHTRGDACDEAGVLFGDSWHGAKLAPGCRKVKSATRRYIIATLHFDMQRAA